MINERFHAQQQRRDQAQQFLQQSRIGVANSHPELYEYPWTYSALARHALRKLTRIRVKMNRMVFWQNNIENERVANTFNRKACQRARHAMRGDRDRIAHFYMRRHNALFPRRKPERFEVERAQDDVLLLGQEIQDVSQQIERAQNIPELHERPTNLRRRLQQQLVNAKEQACFLNLRRRNYKTIQRHSDVRRLAIKAIDLEDKLRCIAQRHASQRIRQLGQEIIELTIVAATVHADLFYKNEFIRRNRERHHHVIREHPDAHTEVLIRGAVLEFSIDSSSEFATVLDQCRIDPFVHNSPSQKLGRLLRQHQRLVHQLVINQEMYAQSKRQLFSLNWLVHNIHVAEAQRVQEHRRMQVNVQQDDQPDFDMLLQIAALQAVQNQNDDTSLSDQSSLELLSDQSLSARDFDEELNIADLQDQDSDVSEELSQDLIPGSSIENPLIISSDEE